MRCLRQPATSNEPNPGESAGNEQDGRWLGRGGDGRRHEAVGVQSLNIIEAPNSGIGASRHVVRRRGVRRAEVDVVIRV